MSVCVRAFTAATRRSAATAKSLNAAAIIAPITSSSPLFFASSSGTARLFSSSSTTPENESHNDFKPKRKATAPVVASDPNDPKALFPVIDKILKEHKIVLFMKGTPQQPMCGFSGQVVRVLNSHGVDYHGVNILEDPVMRAAMKEYKKWPTFPQLYVDQELVGGCDIITQLHQAEELGPLLGVKKQ